MAVVVKSSPELLNMVNNKLGTSASKYKFGARTSKQEFGGTSLNTHLGPGPVNTNFGPQPANTNWGPARGARARAGGQAKGRERGNTNTDIQYLLSRMGVSIRPNAFFLSS